MADDGNKENTVWPMPKFRFEVDLGTDFKGIAFQEVSGMDTEPQTIEYRSGNSPVFSTIKMPGIAKRGNVILKKGIFEKDNRFWDWYKDFTMNIIKRQTVTIKLLDKKGATTMEWQLTNAWPAKITGTDLKSEGNEVAIETLELAYETMTIKNR